MTHQTIGARLYQLLLRFYPREFREEYGAEMACLYRDRARDEGALRLWFALIADLLHTAPSEQLNVLMQDTRQAFRLLLRTPIVTATATITVALGLAGSTAVFSVVYGVLLRPLPYPQPDRLVELFEDNRQANMPQFRVSTLNYLSWAERSRSTGALAAFRGIDFNLTDRGEPERLLGSTVTASMFTVLGVRPLVGRGLRADDERLGSHRIVLLGESLWRRRFGGDPGIVGQFISLSGERYEVVGVVPRTFREIGRSQMTSGGEPQVIVPLVVDPARENRGNHVMRVIGRLHPGVTLDRARDEMRRIAAAMEQEFPATNKGWGIRVETLYDTMLDERVRPSLVVLLAAVGMVLLIACANVANVLAARSVSRQRELALRTALGARRSRLVRQLVTESLCLAAVSGACGLPLAVLAVQTLRFALPPTLPRIDEIGVDATVLGFGLSLTFASGLFMGLVPAVRASRAALMPSLAQQGRGLAGSSRRFLRHVIVVAQMAIATMLLAGAALLLQSFLRLQQVALGFEPESVITTRISLPRARYPDAARTWAFYNRLLESLKDTSHVQAVAVGTTAPFTPGVRVGGKVRDRAQASQSPDASVTAVEHFVSPDYFRTLGVPLLAGRLFGPQDGPESQAVAIISESLARQLWADKKRVGQRLEWNGARQYEVVGVVGDVRGEDGRGGRGGGVDRAPAAAVYLSAMQSPQNTMTLMVRTSSEPGVIVLTIARVVQDIDPAQPIDQVRHLRDWIDDSTAQPRFTATLTGVFAVVALLLAAVGVYGVLSYSVAQRTQEIGVRMAIGAERSQIMRLVLQGGMAIALTGVGIGLLGALALSRSLGALLFDVGARDPFIYSSVGALLALVAIVACYIPAARATRIDPLIALRSE
jgi:putative ABC transport system permease protein